jgi:hypothetical protein
MSEANGHKPPQPPNWLDLTLLVTVGQRWPSYPENTQNVFLERIGAVRRISAAASVCARMAIKIELGWRQHAQACRTRDEASLHNSP